MSPSLTKSSSTLYPASGVTVAEFLARALPVPSTMDWMEPRVTGMVMTSPSSSLSVNTNFFKSTADVMMMASATTRAMIRRMSLRFFCFCSWVAGVFSFFGGVLGDCGAAACSTTGVCCSDMAFPPGCSNSVRVHYKVGVKA